MSINWKYTFGEIAIVIIGISIAFGLNNWWAGVKDRKAESEYLRNISTDLNQDLEALKTNSLEYNEKLHLVGQLRPYIYADLPHNDSVPQWYFKLAEIIKFFPNKGTYNALINSGDLKLIQDFGIRSELESQYNFYQKIFYEEERQMNFHKNFLSEFSMTKIDYDQVFKGNYDFIKEPEIKNIISAIYGIALLGKKTTDEAILRTESFLEELEN